MDTERITYLIVDDNELDAEKIMRGLKRLKIDSPVVRASNGYEALGILRGSDDSPGLAGPYLILLDINMPMMNGLEFLAELRADPKIAHAPVVVLSTSDRRREIEAAYRHNVSGYIVKPVKRDDSVAMLETLHNYWTSSKAPLGTSVV